MRFRGEKLTHLREVMGWSKAEVGRRCGLTASQIGEFESGKRQPNEESLKKICEGLHIDAQYLYLEEAYLPVDIIPNMSDELKKFIMNGSNIPYIALVNKAAKDNISPEAIEKIIEALQYTGKK